MLQVLLFEAQKGTCIISNMNLRTLPNKFEKFLAEIIQKDMHPKFTVVVLQSSLTKNLTPCLILIKQGYLT